MTQQTSAFQKAIDAVESLPLSDQEALLDLLQKRLADHRRQKLTEDIEAVRHEVAEGNVTFGSVDAFLAEMDD